MILEIKKYGDFDILQTVSLFEIPRGVKVKSLLELFVKKYKIEGDVKKLFQNSNGSNMTRNEQKLNKLFSVSGLPYKKLDIVSKKFQKFLRLKGFKEILPYEVSFSD